MGALKHTEAVKRLIDEGRVKEAAELHNAHLERQFKRAKGGAVICLSDLMAAKEILDEKAGSQFDRGEDR